MLGNKNISYRFESIIILVGLLLLCKFAFRTEMEQSKLFSVKFETIIIILCNF